MEVCVALYSARRLTVTSALKLGDLHTQAFLFYAWVVAQKTNLKLVKTTRVIITTANYHFNTKVKKIYTQTLDTVSSS